jgi:hypothetical protein
MMQKYQHIIPAGLITLLGLWVAFVSYTQSPVAAFVFPRLVSAVFVVLAVWTFIKALGEVAEQDGGFTRAEIFKIVPGMIVSAVYVFWGTKFFGFYTSTTLAFFILLSLYDPADHRLTKSWVKRVIITAGFMAVMYCLFALLLNVYTPREIWS